MSNKFDKLLDVNILNNVNNDIKLNIESSIESTLGFKNPQTKQKVVKLLEIYPDSKRIDLPITFCKFNFDCENYDITKASIKCLVDFIITPTVMDDTVKQINEVYQLNKIDLFKKFRKKLYINLFIVTILFITALSIFSIFVVSKFDNQGKLLFGVFFGLLSSVIFFVIGLATYKSKIQKYIK